jgi:hypothetical protein
LRVITFTAPLHIWTSDEGRMHFMRVPEELSAEIRADALLIRRGFGSVRIEASINGFTWRTSVFPLKTGGYFLPVKIAVLRSTGISAGDEVTVELEPL